MLGLKPQQFGRSIKQFFNLADNGVDYGNWNVLTPYQSLTIDSSGVDVTYSNQRSDNVFNGISLKPSTEYTFVFNVEFNEGGEILRTSGADQALPSFTTIIPSSQTGIVKTLVTTRSVITTNSIVMIYNASVTGRLKYKLLAIIEGDATSENITTEQPYGNFDVIYTP